MLALAASLFAAPVLTLAPQTATVQEAYIKASNSDALDRFGFSVALHGDTLVVGATGEDSDATGVGGDPFNNNDANAGAAYVFVRSGGNWSQEHYLKTPAPGFGSGFGAATALSDNFLAITESGSPDNTVHIYERAGTTWQFSQSVLPPSSGFAGGFGTSVSLSDDVLVVGAPFDASDSDLINGDSMDTSAPEAGAAFVYVRSGSAWLFEAYLKAFNSDAFDRFGAVVSLSGNTVVIGAPGESSSATTIDGDDSDNSAPFSGAAYVFLRSGTTWSQQAYVKTGLSLFPGFMGSDLSLAGDTLVVGCEGEGSAASGVNGDAMLCCEELSGAALVFERSGTTWTETTYLKAPAPNDNDAFGQSVATDGTSIIVGSRTHSGSGRGINGNFNNTGSLESGSAYIFERSGSSWVQTDYVKASNADPNDQFATRVALSNGIAVATSIREGSGSDTINGDQLDGSKGVSGAAYVFDLNATIPSAPAGPSMCFGVGSGGGGCVECPCGNNASMGSNGGCLNSTAGSAELVATGDTSVSLHYGAYTDLRFQLLNGVPGSLCVLTSGAGLAPTNMAHPCFGVAFGVQSVEFDGLRCAVQGVTRHGGRTTDAAGEVGVSARPWGGEFNPQAGIAGAGAGFAAGQVRNFQAIYRDDPLLSCMRGLNTSQAVQITFTP